MSDTVIQQPANSYYTAENHGPFELHPLGAFELEEGGVIPDCRLAYTTFGELSPAKDNAILMCTWYSGTHGILAQTYIGEGHALDPSRWFIVVVDQIGSGLSTSPHHGAGPEFPRVRIGDDVRAQQRFLRERFGLEELQLVLGGSMGGQQTYEWAVRFPDQVRRAAPLAATARIPDMNAIYVDALCDALTADPAFAGGRYGSSEAMAAGLARHARLIAILGYSTEFWAQECWRALESRAQMPSSKASWSPTSPRWTPTTCSVRPGSGSTRTSAATPVATWPPRSAGSPRRPSSCRSTRISSSRSRTAGGSRSWCPAASCGC